MNPIIRFAFSFIFGLILLHLVQKSGLFDNIFYVEKVVPEVSQSQGILGIGGTDGGLYNAPPNSQYKDALIKLPNNYGKDGYRTTRSLESILNFPQLVINRTYLDSQKGWDLDITAWSIADSAFVNYVYDKIKKEDLDTFMSKHEDVIRKALSVNQLAQYKEKISKITIDFYYTNNDTNTPPLSFGYYVYFKDLKKSYPYGPYSMVFYDNYSKILEKSISNDVFNNIVYNNLPIESPDSSKPTVLQVPTILGRLFQILFNIKDYFFANFIQIAFIAVMLFSTFFMLGQFRNLQKNQVEVLRPDDIEGNMDDLIGMEDIKKEVMQLKDMYINQSLYKEHGINRPFNVMFSGPPGVGKTKLASYLAKEMQLPIIFANASNLETGLVGGGAGMLKKIYHQANELGRVIVFLDEAQPLLMERGQGPHKWADDTANALLSLLDGFHTTKNSGIISIVASNFDEEKIKMDEAVLRRFQLKINFRLPNKKEREAILKSILAKKEPKYIKADINLGYLAEVTENLSPALLHSILDKASMLAIESKVLIDEDLLMQAFERTVVGLTDRQTTQDRTKDRRIISIHELGHFFVRFDQHFKGNLEETKKAIPVLKISTEAVSKSNALGYVLMKQDQDMLLNREELESKIMCLYGGMANEEIFFGNDRLTTGAYDDLKKITTLLKHMVVDLSMYSNKKINYGILAGELKDVKETQVIKMEEVSEGLYGKTVEILRKYKKITEEITPILVDKYVLTVDEIFKIIEEKISLISIINLTKS